MGLFSKKEPTKTIMNNGIQEVSVVVEGAYSPNNIAAKKGILLRIIFDRRETADCSEFVSFPDLKVNKKLEPMAKTVLEFTPEEAGEFEFVCNMGMYHGKLIVE